MSRDSQETYEIRRANLKKLIEQNYRGDYEQVAAITEKAESTIRKYLVKNSDRPISSKTAREFEKSLELQIGYLDSESHGDKNIYYVTLSVNDSETYEIIEWLYDNAPEVMDCSAILGQFDIILKIEVPNFHYLERFFTRLSRLPKVVRTQTFASVDSLRWQRSQIDYYSVKNPRNINNFVEHYKHACLNELTKQIHDIERGKIVASERSSLKISLLEIMQWTKKSFFAVREYQEKIDQYEEYLQEEAKKISEGVITKRIFILPQHLLNPVIHQEKLQETLTQAKRILAQQGQVKFLTEEKWVGRSDNTVPECFAIVDSSFVYVKKSDSQKSVLHEATEYVESYQRLFERNWEIALSYENLLALL
ncbi:Lrp/AsnC ligand binding domain-containing protein [Thiofilum flexile]|uniref:Lrp/AsnC ligand binding domain-containing protein n=1 Tax=Thiofilum flexile TaxID=125627 RepID=UPI00036DBD61|nr:Lrp/AsnC ligand binding domain-containing protein [Thiofilum flexile]